MQLIKEDPKLNARNGYRLWTSWDVLSKPCWCRGSCARLAPVKFQFPTEHKCHGHSTKTLRISLSRLREQYVNVEISSSCKNFPVHCARLKHIYHVPTCHKHNLGGKETVVRIACVINTSLNDLLRRWCASAPKQENTVPVCNSALIDCLINRWQHMYCVD